MYDTKNKTMFRCIEINGILGDFKLMMNYNQHPEVCASLSSNENIRFRNPLYVYKEKVGPLRQKTRCT